MSRKRDKLRQERIHCIVKVGWNEWLAVLSRWSRFMVRPAMAVKTACLEIKSYR